MSLTIFSVKYAKVNGLLYNITEPLRLPRLESRGLFRGFGMLKASNALT